MKQSSLEAKMVVQNGQRMATMYLSGTVGVRSGFSARRFIESLTSFGKYDALYAMLDSSGGSPSDAWAIFDFLTTGAPKRCRSLVLITGECSGDAVMIALAFDQILMRPAAYMGFRPAKFRNLAAIRLATGVMSRLIAKRAGCQQEDVLAWMDKNKRFTAEECLARSLCDAIT